MLVYHFINERHYRQLCRCNTHKRMLRLAVVIALFTVGMVIINLANINIFQDLFEKVPQETVKSLQQIKNNHSRPNILLIVADDLGFNDVGYHGSGIKTPNLDHLAQSGVRLENYYVQQVCTPTRGQLLSGRHEIHTGLYWVLRPPFPSGLPVDSPTLADKLKEAGYATHLVGKWHVGFFKKKFLPTNRGFDSFFGLLTGHSDYFDHISKYETMSGFDLMDNDQTVNITKYKGYYSTILFADKAKDIIRKHNPNKPLFMYLPFQTPHTPLQAPNKYMNQYKSHSGDRKTIAAMITCMDEMIGEIIQLMKKRGMWKNTVLVFTTDNGGSVKAGASNWPLRGHKGQLWEGGIRAVGFVHSMLFDNRTTGTVSTELMHVTDWFPTLVKLAGGNLNGTKPLDGFDQWKTIRYGAKSPRKEILHHISPEEAFNKKQPFNTSAKASIRMGDWKLITGYKGHSPRSNRSTDTRNIWLFNIKKDPRETNDRSLKMPDRVKKMLKRLEYYRKGMVAVPLPKIDELANPKLHKGFWVPWR